MLQVEAPPPVIVKPPEPDKIVVAEVVLEEPKLTVFTAAPVPIFKV